MSFFDPYLHPRRALRAMQSVPELKKRISALEEELHAVGSEKEGWLKSEERLKKELSDKKGLLSETARKVELYRRKCSALEERATKSEEREAELRKTLKEERAETDAAMNEIASRLDHIDDMRHSYERRIEHLRHALADAHARLAAQADYESVSEMVDMESIPKQKESLTTKTNQENATPRTPQPDDPDTSGWLMPLPE